MDKGSNLCIVTGAVNGGMPFFLDQPKNLIQLGSIQKIGGMTGNKYLPAAFGVSAKFLCQFPQQRGIKLVFRLFHAQ